MLTDEQNSSVFFDGCIILFHNNHVRLRQNRNEVCRKNKIKKMDSNVTLVIILQKLKSKRFTLYTVIDLFLFSNEEKTKKHELP